MGKVGIYSGSFDPIHAGHVAFAQAAMQAGGLDKVAMIPEPEPRSHAQLAPLHHRIAMARLATESVAKTEVIKLNSPQFSYSKTLPELQAIFPGSELHMLIGSDVVVTFSIRWPDIDRLLQVMPLVIGLRGDDTKASVQKDLAVLEQSLGIHIRYLVIPTTLSTVSATQIRQGTHRINDLNPAVAGYIKLHGLYI